MPTANSINTEYLASTAEIKAAISTDKLMAPSTFVGYMNDLSFTGFFSWAAGGPYFDVATLGTFKLLVGGTGYINGKLITWVAQDYVGMTAGNTYYIYIDSTGTIGATTTRTDALFTGNIVLFECLRDSTAVTNNQVVVKENHPYNYSATVSNYEHDNIGTVIENSSNGANITLNGTQGIQINGADVLSDHGLETTIPDSAAAAVTWIRMFTLAGGKWARQNATTTFTGFWNNAGVATALSANRFAVYTLYVSKESLNATTPTYFAVLDNAQYNTTAAATTAISNGSTAKVSNELQALELAQLGYIVYGQASATITSVIISKATLRSTLSTTGTNQAALVNTSITNFNGWLTSTNTNVQSCLETLDNTQRFFDVAGNAQSLVNNQGAISNNGTLQTLTLPATALEGDMFGVVGKGAGGWKVAQNAGQQILFASKASTPGVTGFISSNDIHDCVEMVCTTANTTFTVRSSIGNITVS